MISLAGMDPLRFLNTEDPLEADVMMSIAKRRLEMRNRLASQDAIRIANAVWGHAPDGR